MSALFAGRGGLSALQPAPVRIAGDMMQQCRAGEVVVGRLEVRARVHEVGMRVQEASQFGDVAIVHGGDGRVEMRVRLECGKGFGDFDGVLEARPAVEAILARHDELGVSEDERPGRVPPFPPRP